MSRATMRVREFVVLALASLGHAQASAQSGGGYVLTRSTMDGGGFVHHSGGGYRLGGTVGQSDAGVFQGGNYRLTGGFWFAPAPQAPTLDPSGIDKVRFISFTVPETPGVETAFRITLVELHHVDPPYSAGPSVPFTSFEGQVRWVGPPGTYVESASNMTAFHAASLQCTPHYQDWSTVGLLHVTGSAIVPSSVYAVETMAARCAGNESACTAVSAPLEIRTTRWSDVDTPFHPPDASDQPDFADISALVDKFKSTPGALIKARALLASSDAFGTIDPGPDLGFNHIAVCVDAFRGTPYPYAVSACP